MEFLEGKGDQALETKQLDQFVLFALQHDVGGGGFHWHDPVSFTEMSVDVLSLWISTGNAACCYNSTRTYKPLKMQLQGPAVCVSRS